MTRTNKYRVSPADQRTWNGRVYASKAEMEYAKILDLEQRGGIIRNLTHQPAVRLGPIDFVPDFAAWHVASGKWRWYDVKGVQTPAFKIKLKLWVEYGPGDLFIVKKAGKRFKVVQVVAGGRKEQPNGEA